MTALIHCVVLSIGALASQDVNKELLLNADGVIPTLVDHLLLDPEHPQRQQLSFEQFKAAGT